MAKTTRVKNKRLKAAAGSGKSHPTGAPKWVGQPIRRVEEDRLVRGKGIFVDDQKLTGMLHIRFVRSSYGHAKITRVDFTRRAGSTGGVCKVTGCTSIAFRARRSNATR